MLFDNDVLSSDFSWLFLNKSQLKLELKTFLRARFIFVMEFSLADADTVDLNAIRFLISIKQLEQQRLFRFTTIAYLYV
jgi:hypothetical protein